MNILHASQGVVRVKVDVPSQWIMKRAQTELDTKHNRCVFIKRILRTRSTCAWGKLSIIYIPISIQRYVAIGSLKLNSILFIYRCFKNGRRIVVVPKASSSEEGSWVGLTTYAWSGYVLECRICGVIYRSRQHWYGNTTPESEGIVQTEICHIWPGVRSLQGKN